MMGGEAGDEVTAVWEIFAVGCPRCGWQGQFVHDVVHEAVDAFADLARMGHGLGMDCGVSNPAAAHQVA